MWKGNMDKEQKEEEKSMDPKKIFIILNKKFWEKSVSPK
jgi:hypothetical protein